MIGCDSIIQFQLVTVSVTLTAGYFTCDLRSIARIPSTLKLIYRYTAVTELTHRTRPMRVKEWPITE